MENLCPETIIDSVLSYAVSANETINENFLGKDDYEIGMVPDGPSYYTGIITASTYLVINNLSKEQKFLFIFFEESKNKKIKLINGLDKLFLGKKRPRVDIKTNELVEESELNKKNSGFITDQLEFTTIINNPKNIASLFFSKQHLGTALNKTILDFHKNGFKLIFVSNLNENLGLKECLKKDKELLEDISVGNTVKELKEDFPNIYLLHTISKKLKKQLKIISYMNTGTVGGDIKNTTGYCSIVG